MPLEPSALDELAGALASVGSVVSCRASSDQLPPPSKVTCTPPVGLATLLVLLGSARLRYSLWYRGGAGAGRTGRLWLGSCDDDDDGGDPASVVFAPGCSPCCVGTAVELVIAASVVPGT